MCYWFIAEAYKTQGVLQVDEQVHFTPGRWFRQTSPRKAGQIRPTPTPLRLNKQPVRPTTANNVKTLKLKLYHAFYRENFIKTRETVRRFGATEGARRRFWELMHD